MKEMRKIVSAFFMFGAIAPVFAAATPAWWERSTICQPSNALCYGGGMGAGFDADEWDVGAACKGKKIICANAREDAAYGDEPLSKAEISGANGKKVSDDFDISALNYPKNECFGVRRTRNNGTNAKVGGDWVNVWCPNILDAPDEGLATGDIMTSPGAQPTCRDLADKGYIGILNGQCYGKYGYPPQDFYLECATGQPLPELIVKKNGVPDVDIAAIKPPYPTTEDDAAARFNAMIKNAAEMQKKLADE